MIDFNPPLEHTGGDRLIMYVVYSLPFGFEAKYTMRKSVIGKGIIKWYGWQEWYKDFNLLHKKMLDNGFVPMSRSPEDAPNIVITYL